MRDIDPEYDGATEEEDEDRKRQERMFDMRTVSVQRTCKKNKGGGLFRFQAFVVVGNGDVRMRPLRSWDAAASCCPPPFPFCTCCGLRQLQLKPLQGIIGYGMGKAAEVVGAIDKVWKRLCLPTTQPDSAIPRADIFSPTAYARPTRGRSETSTTWSGSGTTRCIRSPKGSAPRQRQGAPSLPVFGTHRPHRALPSPNAGMSAGEDLAAAVRLGDPRK